MPASVRIEQPPELPVPPLWCRVGRNQKVGPEDRVEAALLPQGVDKTPVGLANQFGSNLSYRCNVVCGPRSRRIAIAPTPARWHVPFHAKETRALSRQAPDEAVPACLIRFPGGWGEALLEHPRDTPDTPPISQAPEPHSWSIAINARWRREENARRLGSRSPDSSEVAPARFSHP